MNVWRKLRICNTILALLPLGALLNFYMFLGLVLDDNKEATAMVFSYFNHSKIIFISYLISEAIVYFSKKNERYYNYTQYVVFLPLITALYALLFIDWSFYAFILGYLFFFGFIASPIAWCIYFVLYLLYRLYIKIKTDETINNEQK